MADFYRREIWGSYELNASLIYYGLDMDSLQKVEDTLGQEG